MSAPAPTGTPTPSRPRTLRTVLLVVGSLVLALLLVLVVGQAVSSTQRVDASGTSEVDENFDRVSVESTAADVRVEQGDVDRAEIVFDAGDTRLTERHRVSGGELVVEVRGPRWSPFDGGVGVTRGASLTLLLPASTEGADLEVESAAGDVALTGTFGDVSVSSTGGDVDLAGAVTDLEIESAAGDVTARALEVDGEIEASTTAGDVELDLATAPTALVVESTGGDQRVLLPDGDYAITTETVVGDVSNALGDDAGSATRYRFSAVAGDITLERR